jgi:hypothetical protein
MRDDRNSAEQIGQCDEGLDSMPLGEPVVIEAADDIEVLAYRELDGSFRIRSWKLSVAASGLPLIARRIFDVSGALATRRFRTIDDVVAAVGSEALAVLKGDGTSNVEGRHRTSL